MYACLGRPRSDSNEVLSESEFAAAAAAGWDPVIKYIESRNLSSAGNCFSKGSSSFRGVSWNKVNEKHCVTPLHPSGPRTITLLGHFFFLSFIHVVARPRVWPPVAQQAKYMWRLFIGEEVQVVRKEPEEGARGRVIATLKDEKMPEVIVEGLNLVRAFDDAMQRQDLSSRYSRGLIRL